MYRLRSRIWDTQTKKWFVPYYQKTGINGLPDVKEILITQMGEIMYRERINGIETLVDDTPKRFIKNGQVGTKDKNGKKYYFNDIVKFTDDQKRKSYGVLIWMDDRLGIGSGPIEDYTAIDQITKWELVRAEIVGNIYDDAKIIMDPEF